MYHRERKEAAMAVDEDDEAKSGDGLAEEDRILQSDKAFWDKVTEGWGDEGVPMEL